MNIKKLLFIGTAVLKIVDIFKINARSMCCVAAFIACISCMCIILVSCTNVETSEPVTPELLPFDEEKMALIPAGSFFRGNRSAHPGGSIDEVPVYLITLTKSFLMRRTEVTQEEYEAVMGSHPAHFKGQDLPVEQVTWHEAIEFCNRLSHNEGLDSCYIYTADEIVCDFQAYGY
ncbi:MAG: SUMF1/EgtB/PvdO family nonheme iron enzyme, partial [Bacteroidetes bacterium]|nr:SUMF1/EgtB/PvdO family nonheme iron enzyme [Bacteroidota bacterium]